MLDNDVSRRGFLGSAALAGLAVGGSAAEQGEAPNERLSVGIVGPGGRGRSLLSTFFQVMKECGADLTAVCDLWSRNRERSTQVVKDATGKEPKVFRRLEDMLAMPGLDAVIIATSDHTHAQLLTRTVQAG